MQVNGISGYQQVMEAEPKSVKYQILIGSFIGMAASAIVGGLWAAGMANTSKVDTNYCDLNVKDYLCEQDASVYDYGFFFTPDALWTDLAQANSYREEIDQACVDSNP